MIRFLYKKFRFWQILNRNTVDESNKLTMPKTKISPDLRKNLKTIRDILGTSTDIIIREFAIGHKRQIRSAVIYIDGLTERTTINESIVKPLMIDSRLFCRDERIGADDIDIIKLTMLSAGDVVHAHTMNEAVDGCLSGETIVFFEGCKDALMVSTQGWASRGVEEAKTEAVVRGPREGFTETLRTNTALLRRKIKSTDLTFETMVIGKRTKTDVCIAYLKSVVNPGLIEEIRHRLGRISTDSILESGYIEQFIEDAPFSIFSTIANSEKPDIVAAKLLEGRAAILVDGTPFVLTVPMLFIESFQSPEDYYSRPYFASMLRMLRFLAFAISTLAPASYVALTTFHQELIPTPLLFTMAAAHAGVPFPAAVEALIMGVTFEILREAGVRLPRPVGQAVSIVGVLVIGDAAVTAGLIGAPVVIIVAITAVSSFVNSGPNRFWGYITPGFSGSGGKYGRGGHHFGADRTVVTPDLFKIIWNPIFFSSGPG